MDENTSVGFSDKSVKHRPSKYYNLDVILAVGYRVNSKRSIIFRSWANKVLKNFLVQGYAINDKRLATLNKIIEIQNKMLSSALSIDETSLVNVISEYTKTFIWCGDKDSDVDPINTKMFHEALDKKHVENRCVIYKDVIHGVALGENTNAFGWINTAIDYFNN